MKPKYTTEELREIINGIAIYSSDEGTSGYLLSSSQVNAILSVISEQQQALIEEIEQRLPHPVVLTPWHNSKSMPDHQQQAGRNEVIGQVTETLEAIRKEIV